MLSLRADCGKASVSSRSKYALSFVVSGDPTLCCFMQDDFGAVDGIFIAYVYKLI
jgi:hypothetical protein